MISFAPENVSDIANGKELLVIPLTIGNSCKPPSATTNISNENLNQCVTMQYTFKPSSVNEQNGHIMVTNTGKVNLVYNSDIELDGIGQEKVADLQLGDGSGNEAIIPSNDSRVVLHGIANEVENENYVDCILLVEESISAPTSSSITTSSDVNFTNNTSVMASGNGISVRLERVSSSISGLKHVRDEKTFQYESSQLSRSRIQLSNSNRTGLKKAKPKAKPSMKSMKNSKLKSNTGKTTGDLIEIEKTVGDGGEVNRIDASTSNTGVIAENSSSKSNGKKAKIATSSPIPPDDNNEPTAPDKKKVLGGKRKRKE